MYTRFLLRCFGILVLGWLAGWPAVWAQTPGLDPNVPNQPGLATPALPPPAPLPTAPARRVLAHPRVLLLEAEAADRPLLRRYKVRATVPDSLSALREIRELVLALQGNAYLTASADEMRWRRDTVRVRLYVGEQFRWAYLRNGNLGDGLLTRAGYREKFFRQTPFLPEDWARLQERILTEAENQGFPFATVTEWRAQYTERVNYSLAAAKAAWPGAVIMVMSHAQPSGGALGTEGAFKDSVLQAACVTHNVRWIGGLPELITASGGYTATPPLYHGDGHPNDLGHETISTHMNTLIRAAFA